MIYLHMKKEILRLLELLLNCDGVGEIDVGFSTSDGLGFFFNLLLGFCCSCCSVCKFLLVNCMAVAGCELFVGEALCVADIEIGFNAASLVAACGAERVMQT